MLNRVILIGRMTRDPELRRTAAGLAVASFAIAVDDSYKGPNGEKTTIFMNVSVFGNGAENVVKFTRKGSLVGVEGRLVQRKYTRKTDNVQVTSTDIIADHVEFLDPKGTTSSDIVSDPADKADVSTHEAPAAPAKKQEGKNLDSIDVVDDDLPF
jgi:single-strand DNA-binding protein